MLNNLLTVELPIPPGREAEWNAWYHSEHMTSLFDEVQTFRRGARYRVRGTPADRPYIVLYEFAEESELRDFLDSPVPRRKHVEYVTRWDAGRGNVRYGHRRVGGRTRNSYPELVTVLPVLRRLTATGLEGVSALIDEIIGSVEGTFSVDVFQPLDATENPLILYQMVECSEDMTRRIEEIELSRMGACGLVGEVLDLQFRLSRA